MIISWRSGLPYDVVRANREAVSRAAVAEIVRQGAVELPGYPGYYVTDGGSIYTTTCRKLRKLRPGTKPGGYNFVGLTNSAGERKYEMVHRLVAIAFIANPFGLPEINHIDGVKSNNGRANLEWCTRSHNARHAFSTGLHPALGPGSLTAAANKVDLIKADARPYWQIAAEYGICKQTVCNIKRGCHGSPRVTVSPQLKGETK